MPEITFEHSRKDYNVELFLLEDPCLRVSTRFCGGYVLLDLKYEFDTELLYAFSYETHNVDGKISRKYYAHYLNGEEDKKEIEVDSDLANLRLADGEFIYNGSYYRSVQRG